ncbi:MAG: DUF3536 domain-containing protein [Pseudomonadota bacterium]
MERYICIHGHFYQPPRENPWLEDIELQDSAYPYHDWNERITAESYAPNSASRILTEDGRIDKIPNNYAKISFNFGPTLLSWMADKAPDAYEAVLSADRMSQKSFSGHGCALAQAYNHLIMPLANRADKVTQVHWGIQDFIHRFGRFPEGMWLPETAVDLETLDILAEKGIRFTILAPRQAARVRPIGEDAWEDVSGERIDPTQAYLLRLPSGRTIHLFFYDGPISRGVAFEGLLDKGEFLAHRLVEAFNDQSPRPQLVNIATDGETYGHHHRHGEMALAYALEYIESNHLARLTNYGQYLDTFPPNQEVEIFENSSWSCVHGVERWWRDCGCNSGMHQGWNQSWRTPLRNALDWLRDTLKPLYEQEAQKLFQDPWAARDDYISLLLDRSPQNRKDFFKRQAGRKLKEAEIIQALRLLEIQRHTLLMYTSCGWFFDELSGIETVQVIEYAGRAIQVASEVFDQEIEGPFLDRLEQARSNIADHGDGRRIYEKWVRPAMVDLLDVTAHYGISSIFEDYAKEHTIYCFHIDQEHFQRLEAGKAKLAVGIVRLVSEITRKTGRFSFAVLHLGDHNLCGGVRAFQGNKAYQAMVQQVSDSFIIADFPETIRRIDHHFGTATYSLRSLFRDEQRKILDQIMETSLGEVWSTFRQIYNYHSPLMRFLIDLGVPLPTPYRSTADFVVNLNLRQAFEAEKFNLSLINTILQEAGLLQVTWETAGLEYALRKTLERLAEQFRQDPQNLPILQNLEQLLGLVSDLPFEVNLWKTQNIYYELLQTVYPEWRWKADQGEENAQVWVRMFKAICETLFIHVP